MADPIFLFGPFRLAPAQRTLFEADKPVRLGSRALELLIVLVQHAGEVVAHDVLVAHVWPNLHVDDGSLRVHVAALRKVLGDGRGGNRYIANVPGRGYSFVATVQREHAESSSDAAARLPEVPSGGNLPVSLTSVIGRAEIIATLARQLETRRFLTILGPGGIGKTTVAVAVAETLASRYPDGVWFVGLASLSDPALVPAAIMSALGQASLGTDAMVSLTAYLRDRRALIVLDNCEHVIEATATVAVALLRAAPGIKILATSREALRADGEWTQRLPSLAIPPKDEPVRAAEARSFPAIELFSERAMASLDGFALDDETVATVVEICRQLDGIPLAIELAAARVDAYGINGLAERINDHLMLATRGRRTALPRHQTLRAALDWSYDLLTEVEASVLRRLAIFAGDFPLDAAVAVASDLSETAIVEHIADLVAKSLVVADLTGDHAEYRLLAATRVYALEKLRAAGEYRDAARRHAEHYRASFARAEAESETRPQAEWLAIYGRHIDDVRAALAWAFGPEGDAQLGVALTVAVVPLWVQLSLLTECAERVERALANVGADAASAAPRMQLSAALGWALMYGVGRGREAGPAWATALSLAEQLDDKDYRLRALWGLCIDQFNNGEFRGALDFARRFGDVVATSTDPVDRLMADRLLGTTLHYLGDQTEARTHIDGVVAHLGIVTPHQIVRFRFDLRVSTHYFRARILWLQGFADQARAQVERNIEEGREVGHALTYCSVLGQAACPIAFLAGDLAAATRYGAMLLAHTERHPIQLWHRWARCFDALVAIKRGDVASGLTQLRGELDRAGDAKFLPRFLLPLGELAASLGAAGEVGAGLALVDETLTRCRGRDEGWYVPELLRIKGDLLREDRASTAIEAATACYDESLALAQRQGALFWELRSALSVARMRLAQDRPAEAQRGLAQVHAKFSEGFDVADVRAARELLDSLPRW